jgi:hypothetical protein
MGKVFGESAKKREVFAKGEQCCKITSNIIMLCVTLHSMRLVKMCGFGNTLRFRLTNFYSM